MRGRIGGMMDHLPPTSFGQSLRHGAWLGFKWTTYIVGPIAALLLLIGIGLTEFDIFFIHGPSALKREGTATALFGPFGLYLSSCFWGVVIGMAWGAIKFARHAE